MRSGELRLSSILTKIGTGVAFALSISVSAQEQSSVHIAPEASISQAWETNWSAALFGRGVSGQNEESRNAGVLALGQAHYKFSPFVDAGIGAWARMESGSTHSLYEINRQHNGFWLDEAFVNFNAFPDYVTISGGALNQRVFKNPLLVDEVSFPAVRERLGVVSRRGHMSLLFQQAIPTSTSMSTRTIEKEAMPTLLSESLMVGVPFGRRLKLELRATHFTFSRLPSQVAFDSFGSGNIVNADVPQRAYFIYGFSGFSYGGDLDVDLSAGVKARVGASLLHNSQAPSEYADASLLFSELDFLWSSTWKLTPRVEYFRSERQASPAFYNSADYGHNNRQGMGYGLRLANQRQRLAFKAEYTDTYLIEADPLQANAKIFMLSLEMFNVGL